MGDALTGGKWGDSWACPVCGGSNSGARLKCSRCEYKNSEELDTLPERVEKTAESIRVVPANLCQNSTKLVSFGE